jgi:hypothetical protein
VPRFFQINTFVYIAGPKKHQTDPQDHQLRGESSEELTFEEVVLQAAGAHELVDQHPVLVLVAVPDQFHQVLMPQLPEKEDLGLQEQSQISLPFIIQNEDLCGKHLIALSDGIF